MVRKPDQRNDDAVGYGNPPKHSRFKKGQSGNPKGRPKGRRNLRTELLEEMAELVPVREGGVAHKVSKRRALVKAMTAKGLQGTVSAAKLVYDLLVVYEQSDAERQEETEISEEDAAILERLLDRRKKENSEEVSSTERKDGAGPNQDDDPKSET